MSVKTKIVKELAQEPQNAKQLRRRLGVESRKITKVLHSLMAEDIIKKENGLYCLQGSTQKTIAGKLVKLGKSFGFVTPDDASGDIFVPGRCLLGALPGDSVQVVLFENPRVAGSREGEVVSLTPGNGRIVGTVEKQNGRLVLIPDNAHDTPLIIKRNMDGGVLEGEKAAGELLVRARRHGDHRVGIVLRLGSADSAKQCAEAILYGAGIERSFPSLVQADAEKMGQLEISGSDILEREDLRDEMIFTIDSASTKDIDDAISITKTKNGYTLGIHIADVSHYVQPKTPLDDEALHRGTSIYFADSVIPMLPPELSNGICSLNPFEDRLAFSCLLKLDTKGRMKEYRFFKSIIASKLKGVYSEINQFLQENCDSVLQEKYKDAGESLRTMLELYEKLAVLRKNRGCMEIESDEPAITIDENGVCVGIEKRERGVSERIIEEFMLLANTAAAHLAKEQDIPFVYRVHEKPTAEKIEHLKNVLTAVGIEYLFQDEIPTQEEYATLLDKTRETSLEKPVHMAVLRSMTKAKYEPIPKGHFGLALEDYAHFTSPIRRYPDLAIHRILTDVVQGAKVENVQKKYKRFANTASKIASERELVAQKIERDCDDCYKAEYMRQFIGEDFDGVISSVMQYGLYVELENSVEGLIHVSNLSMNQMHLVDGVALSDVLSGKTYRLGEPIKVKVTGVTVSQGTVDFSPA